MICKSFFTFCADSNINMFFSDDSWHLFMMRFANSVQHITGQELEVKAASGSDSMTIVEQEIEALRTKVDELSDEVCNGTCTLNTFISLSVCHLAHRAAKSTQPADCRNECLQILASPVACPTLPNTRQGRK
jgi:hypothetical protein